MFSRSTAAFAGITLLVVLGGALGGAPPVLAERRANVMEGDRPADAQIYLDAIKAIRGGKRRQAGQLLQRVLKKFPDSPYAPKAGLRLADQAAAVGADQLGGGLEHLGLLFLVGH